MRVVRLCTCGGRFAEKPGMRIQSTVRLLEENPERRDETMLRPV